MRLGILILLISFFGNESHSQGGFFNNPPTIDKIEDYGPIAENSGDHVIQLTGISPGENEKKQTVTITAKSSNINLVTDLTVVYNSGAEKAKLIFTLVKNANGIATITVRLDDRQPVRNITERTFKVDVFPINGAPTFTLPGSLVELKENVAVSVIKNFATQIDDGDPEIDQKIQFITTIDRIDGSLNFKVKPQIDSKDGSLSFEIDPNTNGEAFVAVVLQDDGGNQHGGISQSEKKSFRIKVNNQPPTLDPINPVTIKEDGGQKMVELTGISSGTNENQPISIQATSDNLQLISTVLVEYKPGESVALLKFTAIKDKFGSTNITVTVNDGQPVNNSISRMFAVTVEPTADTPSVTNALTTSGVQTTSGLVITRNEVDGSEVTHFKITEIKEGTLYHNDGKNIIPNNSFISYQQGAIGLKFTPAASSSRNGSFKIQAATGSDDLKLGGNIIVAQILIKNDPPVITSLPETVAKVSIEYRYEIKATDPNTNDLLKFTITIPDQIKSWLKPVYGNAGSALIYGTAPSGAIGVHSIYIKVEDQFGAFDDQSFQLIVEKQNRLPQLTSFVLNINEDDTIFFTKSDFKKYFSDVDLDTLVNFKMVSAPQYGVLSLRGKTLVVNQEIPGNDLNVLKYIPAKNHHGLDIFDWNASDGQNYALVHQRASIFIASINDPPEIIDFEDNPFVFEFGDDRIAVTDSASVIDGDGDKLQKAIITISTNYIKNEDSLFYEPVPALNFQWNSGELTVLGTAMPGVYEEVIRSLKYINLNRLAPITLKRNIDIVLYDADTNSITYRREILFKNSFIDLDIPSAFTPNDDGVNDTWIINNLDQYEDSNIYIYSRAGQKIFETKNYVQEWDGSYRGTLVPAGVYYYLIQIPKYEKVYTGTLTILR